MTPAELNQLRALAQAATPGPWRVEAQGHASQEVARVNNLEVAPPDSVELAHCADDAAYIAAVSPDVVLALLGEVDKLRAASRAVTQCRCTLVQQSVGDGCEVCNPQLAQRLADEAQAGVPEGWKLVPVEPTVEMRRAGTAANDGIVSDIYRAMLAAAPQPPSAQADALHGVASEHDIGYAAIDAAMKEAK